MIPQTNDQHLQKLTVRQQRVFIFPLVHPSASWLLHHAKSRHKELTGIDTTTPALRYIQHQPSTVIFCRAQKKCGLVLEGVLSQRGVSGVRGTPGVLQLY